MRQPTDLDTAIALMQSHGRIDPDLQIVQLVHQQAVQARRDLADAYWARLRAFIRRQLLGRLIHPTTAALTPHNTKAELCPR